MAWLVCRVSATWGSAGRYKSVDNGGKALSKASMAIIERLPKNFCLVFTLKDP
jgi:hypothetical protein